MLCCPRSENTRSRTRTKLPYFKQAGGAGDFCDAGQHTAKPCCTVISYERGTERPGIWRPQRWNYYYFRAWISVSALLPKEQKHPHQDPHKLPCSKAGDSGDFGDAERHAAKPCCTAISTERGTERPGIRRLQRRIHYMRGAWSNVSALPLKETKRPKQDPRQNILFLKAGDSGNFGDDGQHAAKPHFTVISCERGFERPRIWRPQRRIHYMCEACVNVCALLPEETKCPSQDPRQHTLNRVVGVFFATQGSMLRSRAARRQVQKNSSEIHIIRMRQEALVAVK